MTEEVETAHVACGDSAVSTLRKALPLLGSTERVIGLPDSLSVGHIDPPDPTVRQAWSKSTLRNEIDVDPVEVEKAWSDATAPDIHPVFWVCLRSRWSTPAFWRLHRAWKAAPSTSSTQRTSNTHRPTASGAFVLSVRCGRRRSSRRACTRPDERSQPRNFVRRRCAGRNCAGRTRRSGSWRTGVCRRSSHYDALLVGQASQDWEVAARLIGRMFDKLFSLDALAGEGTSDVVLFGRVLALGESGALEITGCGPGMRDYQVRKSAG